MADRSGAAQEFEDRNGWSWPSIEDRDRVLAGKLGAAYQPVVILIDAAGGIVGRHIGGGETDNWQALAAQL